MPFRDAVKSTVSWNNRMFSEGIQDNLNVTPVLTIQHRYNQAGRNALGEQFDQLIITLSQQSMLQVAVIDRRYSGLSDDFLVILRRFPALYLNDVSDRYCTIHIKVLRQLEYLASVNYTRACNEYFKRVTTEPDAARLAYREWFVKQNKCFHTIK